MSLGSFRRAMAALLGILAISAAAPAMAEQKAALPGAQMLTVDAVVVPGADPLQGGVNFEVKALTGPERGKVVASAVGARLEAELPKGQYMVNATYGVAQTKDQIQVDGQPIKHRAVLNAGEISVELIVSGSQKVIKAPVEWEILTYGKDSEGNRWSLADDVGQRANFVLPHGWYIVKAYHDGHEVKHTLEVTAGIAYNYQIALNLD